MLEYLNSKLVFWLHEYQWRDRRWNRPFLPWPWIGSYGILLCSTYRPLPTHRISLKSENFFGRMDTGQALLSLLLRVYPKILNNPARKLLTYPQTKPNETKAWLWDLYATRSWNKSTASTACTGHSSEKRKMKMYATATENLPGPRAITTEVHFVVEIVQPIGRVVL